MENEIKPRRERNRRRLVKRESKRDHEWGKGPLEVR